MFFFNSESNQRGKLAAKISYGKLSEQQAWVPFSNDAKLPFAQMFGRELCDKTFSSFNKSKHQPYGIGKIDRKTIPSRDTWLEGAQQSKKPSIFFKKTRKKLAYDCSIQRMEEYLCNCSDLLVQPREILDKGLIHPVSVIFRTALKIAYYQRNLKRNHVADISNFVLQARWEKALDFLIDFQKNI